MPWLTVVTVTSNVESTIDATAASLRIQRFTDYEWLVVDNASRDQTLQRVQASGIAQRRVVSEPDRGIYDAMNKAVALARGRWLYFLNAGDALADADVLADVFELIAARPDTELVWGDVHYVAPGGCTLVRFNHVSATMLPFEDLNHQATFVQRSLFDKVGHFNLDFRTSADYDWFLRVFRAGVRKAYLRRVIARFDASGEHNRNPQALRDERQRLRLQYMPAWLLALGLQVARVRRRWRMTVSV